MSQAPDTAMVLAAGFGTRMRPLTDVTPKPLINVAGKALIDYALDQFADAGVRRAVVNVHYLADQIEAHLRGREAPEIIFSDERKELMETGGGLKKAQPVLGDKPIFCTNTDAIIMQADGAGPCAALADAWDGARMDALLLLVPIAKTSGYDGRGDFDQHKDGTISLRSGDAAPFVFTGLQILNPGILSEGPEGPFSTRLLWESAGRRARLFGAVYEGDWLHVGDAGGLRAAEARLGDGGAGKALR